MKKLLVDFNEIGVRLDKPQMLTGRLEDLSGNDEPVYIGETVELHDNGEHTMVGVIIDVSDGIVHAKYDMSTFK